MLTQVHLKQHFPEQLVTATGGKVRMFTGIVCSGVLHRSDYVPFGFELFGFTLRRQPLRAPQRLGPAQVGLTDPSVMLLTARNPASRVNWCHQFTSVCEQEPQICHSSSLTVVVPQPSSGSQVLGCLT